MTNIVSFLTTEVTNNPVQTIFLFGHSGSTFVSYSGSSLTTNMSIFKTLHAKNTRQPSIKIGSHVWTLESAKCSQLNNTLWLVTRYR
jgi:hypothetical protein